MSDKENMNSLEYKKGFEAGFKETIPSYILYTKDFSVEYREGYRQAKEELRGKK